MVGREGMLGAQLALGVATAPLRALVQGPGAGLAHRRARLSRRAGAQPGAAARAEPLSLRADGAVGIQCRVPALPPDRPAPGALAADEPGPRARRHFHVTHEFLAYMLGVRRVGITGAAGALQRSGLIEYHRGDAHGARPPRPGSHGLQLLCARPASVRGATRLSRQLHTALAKHCVACACEQTAYGARAKMRPHLPFND